MLLTVITSFLTALAEKCIYLIFRYIIRNNFYVFMQFFYPLPFFHFQKRVIMYSNNIHITYIFDMRSNYLCSCKVSVIMEVRAADAYIQTPALKFSAPGIHHTGGVLEIYRNIYHITGFLTRRNKYEPSKTALLNFFAPSPSYFQIQKIFAPSFSDFPQKSRCPSP